MQWLMFSKHLAPYSVPEVGAVIRDLGLDGVDLTLRPAGHVLPENVREGLPAAVEALSKLGVAVPMITTGVTDASDPHADAIFATAAKCGIKRLKLGYWPYKGFGTMAALIDDCQRKMDGIEALAKKHGVRACIHVHSGNYASANAVVIYMLLKGRDPEAVGAYIDPGHMTAEGSVGGWRQGMDLLAPMISLVAVKSMAWERTTDAGTGDVLWRTRLVPLREGAVRWREVFANLHHIGYDGPVSFHSEYQGSHSWRDLTVEELIKQTREDVAYIKEIAG
jgi:sugar phosphate isomerase/epimerase